jgi:hypothetical protein
MTQSNRDGVPTMLDLERIAARHPVVKAHLNYWRHGDISLERALIALAVYLAEREEKLSEFEMVRFQNSPIPTIVPEHLIGESSSANYDAAKRDR